MDGRLRGQPEQGMRELASEFLAATPSGKLESTSAALQQDSLESSPAERQGIQMDKAAEANVAANELATLHPAEPMRSTGDWEPRQLEGRPRIATLFSTECTSYFDWQTLGLVYSFKRSGQPGPLVRLLSCSEAGVKEYKGMDMAPTMVVPSWNRHPITKDW